jgi:hypothetical protein
VVIVRVPVTGVPSLGLTDSGLKAQVASAGKPLQAKFTWESNPFAGVTVNVAVPLCPATMVRVDGFTVSW